jgi:hypothetical protein
MARATREATVEKTMEALERAVMLDPRLERRPMFGQGAK